MFKFFLIVNIVLATTIPVSENSPIKFEEVEIPKSCYINAINYRHAYDAKMSIKGIRGFSRLMRVECTTVTIKGKTIILQKEGHMILIFSYKNRYKCYDPRFGTLDLGEFERVPAPAEIIKLLSKEYSNPSWYK